jgi:hypothetical protein
MESKYKAGSFVDPEGYKRAIEQYQKVFEDRLASEQAGHPGR